MADGRILRKDGTSWNKATHDPALVDWIANEGARTSAIVHSFQEAGLEDAVRAVRDAALGGTSPNPIRLARSNEAVTVRPPDPASRRFGSCGRSLPSMLAAHHAR